MSYDIFGQHISENSILTTMKTIGQEFAHVTQDVKEQLLEKPVLNSDESGIRMKGTFNWLHMLSITILT